MKTKEHLDAIIKESKESQEDLQTQLLAVHEAQLATHNAWKELGDIRESIIFTMSNQGASAAKIARTIGVSRQRVDQMIQKHRRSA